jgi:hypothetical protein
LLVGTLDLHDNPVLNDKGQGSKAEAAKSIGDLSDGSLVVVISGDIGVRFHVLPGSWGCVVRHELCKRRATHDPEVLNIEIQRTTMPFTENRRLG